MRKLLLLLILAILVAAGAASADPFSWTGPYLGGDIGDRGQVIDGFNTVVTPYVYPGFNYPKPLAGVSSTAAGAVHWSATGDLRAGYLLQAMPMLVLGVEGEIGRGQSAQTASQMVTTNPLFFVTNSAHNILAPEFDTLTAHASFSWTGSLRARVGIPVTDNLLLSTFAGPAFALAKISASQSSQAWVQTIHPHDVFEVTSVVSAYGAASREQVLIGPTAGLAWDYAIAGNWLIRAEYSFSSFGPASVRLVGGGGSVSIASTGSMQVHSVRVGAAYKF